MTDMPRFSGSLNCMFAMPDLRWRSSSYILSSMPKPFAIDTSRVMDLGSCALANCPPRSIRKDLSTFHEHCLPVRVSSLLVYVSPLETYTTRDNFPIPSLRVEPGGSSTPDRFQFSRNKGSRTPRGDG